VRPLGSLAAGPPADADKNAPATVSIKARSLLVLPGSRLHTKQ